MAISKENMPENNSSVQNKALPEGQRTHYSSRPTGIVSSFNSSSNSSEDEMKYGRIVKIIKATTKNNGG